MKIALVEDDARQSANFAGWLKEAWRGADIYPYYSRDEAIAGIKAERFDLVVLDVQLQSDRNGGFAVINAVNTTRPVPVLVVSSVPAALYKGAFKALDAWEYLEKSSNLDSFKDEFMDANVAIEMEMKRRPSAVSDLVAGQFDPFNPTWSGKRLSVPLIARSMLGMLVAQRGQMVSYDQLANAAKTGKNPANVRKHIQIIREAFKDADLEDPIKNEPKAGYKFIL